MPVIEYFQQQSGSKPHRGIYSAVVVLWLMILQRLNSVGTLAVTVGLLQQGAADALLADCRRVREHRISARTGGYCRARTKLSTLLCRNVFQEMTEQLRKLLGFEADPSRARLCLLDGSSLELEHSRELTRLYPPARNQHGNSHWPVLRVVVVHDLETGLAEQMQWGPMYGASAVSEQQLAEQAFAKLPSNSVVIGDRNFGVLWVVAAADKYKLHTIVRLTEARAKKLWGGCISQEGEKIVVWQATRFDGGKGHSVEPGTVVVGRLIAARIGRSKSKQWLYLFTTMTEWPAKQVVAAYGGRWNVETDLRALKRTIRFHHIDVKSDDMLCKELLIGLCAYNLVRTVMTLTARNYNMDPRQLSFSMVLNYVEGAWPRMAAATTPDQLQRELDLLLKLTSQCTLPNRKRPRSYPRAQWRKRAAFPFRRTESK